MKRMGRAAVLANRGVYKEIGIMSKEFDKTFVKAIKEINQDTDRNNMEKGIAITRKLKAEIIGKKHK